MSATRTNAETDADIARAVAAADFSEELAAEGIITVSLDADGRLVVHDPSSSDDPQG